MPSGALEAQLFDRVQALRIPPQPEAAAADWKDWYHFVLLDPVGGWRVLANVNLAGGGGRAELQWTLVVHRPGQPPQMHAASRSLPWRSGLLRTRPLSIRSDEVELTLDAQVWRLDLRPRGLDLALQVQARADSTPLLVTEGSPLGSGFIGWGLVPRLLAHGEVSACGTGAAITPAWFCYQDHNFGRVRWGEDFGWEWLAAHAQPQDGPPVTVVVDRRTDRGHRSGGLPYLFVVLGRELRKVFLGPALALRWTWSERSRLPARLPGTLASLLSDRTEREPVALCVEAADERDRLSLRLAVDAHLQIVAPDTQGAAFTRIGEASGPTTLALSLGGQALQAQGLAYAEYPR